MGGPTPLIAAQAGWESPWVRNIDINCSFEEFALIYTGRLVYSELNVYKQGRSLNRTSIQDAEISDTQAYSAPC